MTSKEKYKMLIKTGAFDFIRDMPKEQFWKFVFFIFYVYGNEKENEDIENEEK